MRNQVWCLVGNIVDQHPVEQDKEIEHGTKHFSSNSKVHCFPVKWGTGYEKIKVIGRHRKTKRMVCMVIPTKFITNWRLQKVYNPYIVDLMLSQHGWTDGAKNKDTILDMLKWLPERTTKVNY